MEKVLTPCSGMNCGCTDGISHSLECQAEHAAAIAGGVFVKAAKPETQGEQSEFDRDPLETAIDNFVSEYELNDGEAFPTPSEFERLLIKDAIMGLLADEAFDSYWGNNIEKIAQEKAAALLADGKPNN